MRRCTRHPKVDVSSRGNHEMELHLFAASKTYAVSFGAGDKCLDQGWEFSGGRWTGVRGDGDVVKRGSKRSRVAGLRRRVHGRTRICKVERNDVVAGSERPAR